jgi:two-component system response regulator DesR
MRTTIQQTQPRSCFERASQSPKLRVVLADQSPEYLKAVLALLELHETIELIGRAANIEEAVQLVLRHEPDMVLIDLDMDMANLLIPAVVISARNAVKVVGMCMDETISLRQLELLTGINALVHRTRLQEELLFFVDAFSESGKGNAVAGGSIAQS